MDLGELKKWLICTGTVTTLPLNSGLGCQVAPLRNGGVMSVLQITNGG